MTVQLLTTFPTPRRVTIDGLLSAKPSYARRRMLDELNIAAFNANKMNRALRRCVIGKITPRPEQKSTFYHPV